MRKAILISALALVMAGCATSSAPPQVRDLSMSRAATSADTVNVETGDTLYGIAWRHNIDFRELARLNNLAPPYRLEPGQSLRLSGDAQPSGGAGQQAGSGVTGAAQVTASSSDSPDWLAPDTQAIENNRRLTSQPLGNQPSRPSGEALAAAGEAGGSDAPGPIYNFDSPGADGQLSERDRAERQALARERERMSESASNAQRQTTTGQPQSQAATGTQAPATVSNTTPETTTSTQPSTSDTTSSSTQRDTSASGNDQAAANRPDAGTVVAGEADAPAPQQRTFTPAENIEWQWPVEGQVTGQFGEGTDITAGIDIAGQKGQPVKAAGAGIVVYAGDGVRGYGNLILLKHNDQFLSAYAHNDSLRVQENDVVEAGEVIATMGDTDADSVKLHFEVRQDGQPQDPLQYLPQR